MPELPKTYEPAAIEERWSAQWLADGCFHADPESKKPAYSIVIPPPNVTGMLHLGHVLNATIQDILARRARMLGKEVLWLPGTDHAGIATQTVVERTLKKQGVIRHRNDLGREKFIEKVWEWKEKHGGIIIQQLKKLGCSCDWERERFTMDAEYSKCVSRVFVDLYKKGLIYRGKRMVNWCPASLTALSDEEVIMKPQNGTMFHFKVEVVPRSQALPRVGEVGGETPSESAGRAGALGSEWLTIATTRPETIPGDTAIAVNPKDPRYAHLIGRHVRRPLPVEMPGAQKLIPIIGDDHVDFAFGTGVLKVTPAHDKADFEIGQRHGLAAVDIMNPDGTMNALAGEALAGLDRFEARKVAVEQLRELGVLVKEEPYQNNVGYSERADVPIEPRLSEQWFLKYPSVEQARACVEPAGWRDVAAKTVQIVSIRGDELGSGDRAEMRESALEMARNKGWIGSTFLNEDTGWQIALRRKSFSHAFNNRNAVIIQAVAALPELIRTAVLLRSEDHQPLHPRFRRVHHFVAALTVGRALHSVPITVKELADGRLLYDFKAKKWMPGGKPLGAHSLAGKLGLQPAPSIRVQLADLIADVNEAHGKMRFYPERWAKVYDHWLGGLQDWCISRQLWWGHRIPVWRKRGTEDEMHLTARALFRVLPEEADIRIIGTTTRHEWNLVQFEKSKSSLAADGEFDLVVVDELPHELGLKLEQEFGFTQDPDVLDTWFSSWLWPFATMGWPEKTDTLAKFYPTTDLVTGPDIIFFWVARMIMAGFEWMGEMPFKNVYFTGIIRDKQGRKMSKSLGNSPDPLDLIATYGADALRFGVMRSAPLGADILFDDKNVELGRNFCTKLWNAARFRQMAGGGGKDEGGRRKDETAASEPSSFIPHPSAFPTEGEIDPALLTSDDKWILLRLDRAIREVSTALDEYRFSDAAQTLYRFFWSEYCDWYLEASKAALNLGSRQEDLGADPGAERLPQSNFLNPKLAANTLAVMDFVFAHTLRLMHPFLPFITEELWHGLGFHEDLPAQQGGATIMFARWPEPLDDDFKTHYGLSESDEQFAAAKHAVVNHGRALRRDAGIASNKRVRFVFQPDAAFPPEEAEVLKILLNAETLALLPSFDAPKGTPAAHTPLGRLFLPLEGVVDVAAERERLQKEIAKATDELAKVRAKLANPNFAGKVPPAVLAEHQQRESGWAEKIGQLERLREALGA